MKSCARFSLATMFLLPVTLLLAACGGGTSKLPTATSLAYVANSASQSVSIINIPANQTIATIPIDNGTTRTYPQEVVFAPDQSRAYVPDGNTAVWVIDPKTNSVITSIPVTEPQRIAISPDGTRVYVTTIFGFAVIDTTSDTVIKTIALGAPPSVSSFGIAVSPDASRVYVGNQPGNNIWVIDTATNSLVGSIPTKLTGIIGLSVSPDGKRIYSGGVANSATSGGGFLDVVDVTNNSVIAHVSTGRGDAFYVAVTPDGSDIFVGDSGGDVEVIDAANLALVASRVLDPYPIIGIAFTPNGSHAYISGGREIYVMDTKTFVIVNTIDTPNYSAGLTIVPATR